ncbi:hypothetical protein HDU76_001862 [Blyttiomyces sp. JEL0837]|nr:hypothetical protein HDU76_001862 [Blyttiomyces sp. JEL0837]
MNLSNWLRIGLYGGIHFIQLFTSILTLGGIADQARYGPSKVCLLFIEDYQTSKDTAGYYLFTANSSACSGIIGLATAGMLLSILIGGISLFYIVRSEFRAVRLIFGMAVLSAIYTVMALIMAIVSSAGLNKTCTEFKNGGGFACDTIFNTGFFEGATDQTYKKNLGTVQAAVASAWFCFISWVAYTALEFLVKLAQLRVKRWNLEKNVGGGKNKII